MAAAVMGDAAISTRGQKQHLVFPCVRAERPAMAEDYGLSRAPVLVVDLRAIFCRDCRHKIFSLRLWLMEVIAAANVAGGSPPSGLGEQEVRPIKLRVRPHGPDRCETFSPRRFQARRTAPQRRAARPGTAGLFVWGSTLFQAAALRKA